jgi:hypothetical protein
VKRAEGAEQRDGRKEHFDGMLKAENSSGNRRGAGMSDDDLRMVGPGKAKAAGDEPV